MWNGFLSQEKEVSNKKVFKMTRKKEGIYKKLEGASQSEKQIFEIWCRLAPDEMFKAGLKEYAGKFFVRKKEVVETLLKKVEELEKEADTEMKKMFLSQIRTTLLFDEPYMVADGGVWAIYSHLVKEGVVLSHITSLLKNLVAAFRVSFENHKGKDYSTEIKIITVNQLSGLKGILDVVEKEVLKFPLSERRECLQNLAQLRREIHGYKKHFAVEGIVNGDFSEVYPVLKEMGGDIGRKGIYPDILKNMYAYPETPQEIEEKGLKWLKEELPELKRVTEDLATLYKCENSVEAVTQTMRKKRNVDKKEVVDFIESLRKVLHGVVQKYLVRVNPNYDTRVVETPPYLIHFIPTAAMSPFDFFTEKEFNNFFVTTDEKRSPPAGYCDLFQLLIHEEYGHCVNFSNTSTSFAAEPDLLELLPTTFRLPVSDGISFFRELESLQLLRILLRTESSVIGKEERELLDYIKKFGEPQHFLLEVEFVVYKWRIIRFLRAIGDIRINMHRQSVAQFVDWAHKETGLSKSLIFDQIFLFQAYVGYAPCYAIAGEKIRQIQREAIKKGVDVVDFNTYASSLGFPPRPIFEEKLRSYVGKRKI